MTKETETETEIVINRCYDQELIKIAASALVYMLSEKTSKDMAHDHKLAMDYKSGPTTANFEAIREQIRKLKNPLHSDAAIPLAHSVFIVLSEIFEATISGINLPPESQTPEIKQRALVAWISELTGMIAMMAEGSTLSSDPTVEAVKEYGDEPN